MSLKIIIDTREKEVIKTLETRLSIVVEQLDVGDIVFRIDNDDILTIERKTILDLKASIVDGRNREQKSRLMGTTSRDRILYLVEGELDKSLDSKLSGLPVSTLVGSMINTQFRDGIKVYKTSNIFESCEFLVKLYDKLVKDGDNFFGDNLVCPSKEEYSSSLKKSKKANMTPDVWFISILSSIPQVTDKISCVIAGEYVSMNNLVDIYNKTPEHLRVKLLSDLKYPLSSGKERRIGDVISGRIYNFVYGIK